MNKKNAIILILCMMMLSFASCKKEELPAASEEQGVTADEGQRDETDTAIEEADRNETEDGKDSDQNDAENETDSSQTDKVRGEDDVQTYSQTTGEDDGIRVYWYAPEGFTELSAGTYGYPEYPNTTVTIYSASIHLDEPVAEMPTAEDRIGELREHYEEMNVACEVTLKEYTLSEKEGYPTYLLWAVCDFPDMGITVNQMEYFIMLSPTHTHDFIYTWKDGQPREDVFLRCIEDIEIVCE